MSSAATAQCLLSFLLLGAALLATPSLADDEHELPPKPAPGPGHHPRRPCFRPGWGHPPGMPPFPEPIIGEGHALPPYFGPGRGRKFDPKKPHPPPHAAGTLPPIPSWFGKGPHGPDPFHGGDDCFDHFGGPAHAPHGTHPHHPAAGDHPKHPGDKRHPMPPGSAPI